eukprot:jgi/Mesen1/9483/ME000063S08930
MGPSRATGSMEVASNKRNERSTFDNILRRLNNAADAKAAAYIAYFILLAECLFSAVIIWKVPYTKIDWDAYMSQVTGFLEGERNYNKLEGDTGPLVYPAGFLYIYSGLQYLTRGNIFPAQVIFGALYVVNQALVLLIYVRSKVVPPWALVLLALSKRVRSIFMLRLFNDCFAMTLLHAAMAILQSNLWTLGLAVFSAAVSVKMNVLLFAPPLQMLLFKGTSWLGVFAALATAALVQLAVGYPFLIHHPKESVNFKFVHEDFFVSKPFALALLVLHLSMLLLFAARRWCRHEGGMLAVMGLKNAPGGGAGSMTAGRKARFFKGRPLAAADVGHKQALSPEHVATLMLTGNFIGIMFARSLHYQFYSWYFHSIPYLLWRTSFPTPIRLVLFAIIEICWNVYPSTAASSLALLSCHLVLLGGLWWGPHDEPHTQIVKRGRKVD